MNKITSLVRHALIATECPTEVRVTISPSAKKLPTHKLACSRILNPYAVIVANMQFESAYGRPLIHISGGIYQNAALPAGCLLMGDLDLEKCTEPLGIIQLYIMNAVSEVKAALEDDNITTWLGEWRSRHISLLEKLPPPPEDNHEAIVASSNNQKKYDWYPDISIMPRCMPNTPNPSGRNLST
ncbi:conserved hypothetical protein [Vibrio chagasii]|nr:hypothetical protein AOG25_08635 [Vibrio alginolyticus]CAH7145788.1 conserved hypothetical protein [Vibrio chagasii]CAH7316751.1 conserved hypothetical protein [Vibrio chagasii]